MRLLALPLASLIIGMVLCTLGPLPNERAGAGFPVSVESWVHAPIRPASGTATPHDAADAEQGALQCARAGRNARCTRRLNEAGRSAVPALVGVTPEGLARVA